MDNLSAYVLGYHDSSDPAFDASSIHQSYKALSSLEIKPFQRLKDLKDVKREKLITKLTIPF